MERSYTVKKNEKNAKAEGVLKRQLEREKKKNENENKRSKGKKNQGKIGNKEFTTADGNEKI